MRVRQRAIVVKSDGGIPEAFVPGDDRTFNNQSAVLRSMSCLVLTCWITLILLVDDAVSGEAWNGPERDVRTLECSVGQQLSIQPSISRMIDVLEHPSIKCWGSCIFHSTFSKYGQRNATRVCELTRNSRSESWLHLASFSAVENCRSRS